MEEQRRFCPNCKSALLPDDRFCGDCGFDTHKLADSPAQPLVDTPAEQPADRPAQQLVDTPARQQPVLEPQGRVEAADGLGRRTGGSKSALVILISLLAGLFLIGGGLYWWLSRSEDGIPQAPKPAVTQNDNGAKETAPAVDLTRAETYLSKPGIVCTFEANYPDGAFGIVKRYSGQVVPNEAVRVTEVETGMDQGEEFGFTVHYVERADGSYVIYDHLPFEIMPLLKNDLTVGSTWNYQDQYGQITWTVLDMGVNLDLEFTVFEDCLMVQEVNEMADFHSITYYAPGYGSVLVTDPSGSINYYKMTGFTPIPAEEAAKEIIRWSPNYQDIGDEGGQTY